MPDIQTDKQEICDCYSESKKIFNIFRDTYNLNGPSNPDGSYDDSLVMKLNPFYYTCLIPLGTIHKLRRQDFTDF